MGKTTWRKHPRFKGHWQPPNKTQSCRILAIKATIRLIFTPQNRTILRAFPDRGMANGAPIGRIFPHSTYPLILGIFEVGQMGGNVSHRSNNPDLLLSCRKIHNSGHLHKKDPGYFPERVVSIFQIVAQRPKTSARPHQRAAVVHGKKSITDMMKDPMNFSRSFRQ